MNKIEILKLAAKAVGYTVVCTESKLHGYADSSALYEGLLIKGVQEIWTPFTDNTQALELAAALNMDIIFSGYTVETTACDFGYHDDDKTDFIYPWSSEDFFESDKLEAIRSAIVKTAAKVGALK